MFQWNEENQAKLIQLLETETRQGAADLLGCSLSSVKAALKKFKIKFKKKTGSNLKKIFDWPKDFTEEQNEILIGLLLGDGFITRTSPAFRLRQCRDFREYIVDIHGLLKPYTTDKIHDASEVRKGTITYSSMCITSTGPCFVDLRNKWYPDGIKIVPKDIKLTSLICAHWFVGDGQNRQSKRELILNTNSFIEDDTNFLVERLQVDLGIKCHIRRKGSNINQWLIVMGNQYNNEGYFQFLDVIRSHLTWDCFQYKVDITEAVKKHPNRLGPKLDLYKAQEIRALDKSGNYTQTQIGEMFGIRQATVSSICLNEHWKD